MRPFSAMAMAWRMGGKEFLSQPGRHGGRIHFLPHLVGKIDAGFHEGHDGQQPFPQIGYQGREISFQLGRRRLHRPRSLGPDHVHDRFGAGEIDPSVQESTAGEFPRAGQLGSGRQNRGQDFPEYGRTTMGMDFHHVFPRIGAGSAHQEK